MCSEKVRFVQHLSWSFNDVLRTCVLCFKLSKEFTHLCIEFEVLPTDFFSKGKLSSVVFSKFRSMCNNL